MNIYEYNIEGIHGGVGIVIAQNLLSAADLLIPQYPSYLNQLKEAFNSKFEDTYFQSQDNKVEIIQVSDSIEPGVYEIQD